MQDKIQEHFDQFDRENPEVYERFCALVNHLIAAGRKHYSADALLHVIRFERDIRTTGAGEFDGRDLKINNNFSSRYARKFQRDFPCLADFFEVRRLKSNKQIVGAKPHHDRAVNAAAA